MACDMFSLTNANVLLQDNVIYFFGDSNIRALYKDLLWLLEDGRLISLPNLRNKNELSFANDTRISNGTVHSGRTYQEIRRYANNNIDISFYFLTRLYLPDFIETIKSLDRAPNIIIMNSSLWDISRWGADGVNKFKNNLLQTFSLLEKEMPTTRIIWITTAPPSFYSYGGLLTEKTRFLRELLPYHTVFANQFASDVANTCKVDVLDLHYVFKFLLEHRTKDGIHWQPKAMRLATNMLLTHIALLWNYPLPGLFKLDDEFLKQSTVMESTPICTSQNVNQVTVGCQNLEAVLRKWKKDNNVPKNLTKGHGIPPRKYK